MAMGKLFVFCGAPGTGSINILLLGKGIVFPAEEELCANIGPEAERNAKSVGREARRIHGENITATQPYQIVLQLS
jgi:hypothetical protein